MLGTVAQIVALTAYGNDYLRNGIIPPDFASLNTAFQFCNKVDFSEFKKGILSSKTKEKVVSDNPTEWFKYLRTSGCKYLRLYYESSKDESVAKDYKLAGFVGGGGVWLIEAVYFGYSQYWANRWEVTDMNAVDRKIWVVNYATASEKQPTRNYQFDNQSVKNKLAHTLDEITDFAYKQNFQYWAEIFEKSRDVLDSVSPEGNYYHNDLIPLDNYSLTAKQILFSAGTAWVFGGMGSWNDLGCSNEEDSEIYEKLSKELYSIIIEAIIAGTNTY